MSQIREKEIMLAIMRFFFKLWLCHLSHISRGRMKRLVKEEILAPLDFSILDHCINCIKGKYVNTLKRVELHVLHVY
jgi:hypothetical protein